MIGFYGELNALSNFHLAEFEMDGIKFPTSKHYIQYTKARFFGDNLAAVNILGANTPADSKALGWSIANFDKDKWEENAKSLCLPGIREKFFQNKNLMDILLLTKGLAWWKVLKTKYGEQASFSLEMIGLITPSGIARVY